MAVAVIETIQNATSSGTNLNINTGDFTPNPSVGDLLVSFFCICSGTGRTITLPSGWAVVRDTTGGTFNGQTSIAYKIADSSDATGQSLTWSISGGNTVLKLSVMRITGHRKISNPIQTSSSQENASSTTITAPTLTPTFANSMILLLMLGQNNQTISTYALATSSPSFTENYESSANNFVASMAWGVRPEITATGNGTAVLDSTATTNMGHMVIVFPPQSDTLTDTTTITDALIQNMSSLIIDTIALSDSVTSSVQKVWTNVTKNISTWINQDKS